MRKFFCISLIILSMSGFAQTGETRVLDHPLPIFVDHNIFLPINKVKWSDFPGEDWAK